MASESEEADGVSETSPLRPSFAQRKSSFSDTLNRITNSSFNRRRTTTLLPSSTARASTNQHSRLPTPSGIPRSNSFFSSLNSFTSRTIPSNNENDVSYQINTRRPRKISDRLAQTPFFSKEHQQRNTTEPLTPRKKRDPSVKIEHRGLMQPVHPPLPRSYTMGNLAQNSSPYSPNFMRPTSSSTNRRQSLTVQKPSNAQMPTSTSRRFFSRTPTTQNQRPSTGYPTRKDSLLSAPAKASATVAQSKVTATKPHTALSTPEYSSDESGRARDLHAEYVSLHDDATTENEDEDEGELSRVVGRTDSSAQHSQESFALSHNDEAGSAVGNPDYSNPRLIHTAQPPTYWLGRYTALSDRFLTSALPSDASPSSPDATTISPKESPMHDPARRNRRVFIHLRSLCTTDEAKASLESFQVLWEERERKMQRGASRGVNGGGNGAKVKEKKGWLDGLMGRKGGSGRD